MALTVLSVAYPLAPVGRDAVGGAEQVLTLLDEALVDAGHRSLVVACEGSQTHGTLLATPRIDGPLDEAAKARAQAAHRIAIARALEEHPIDVVHLHGVDFPAYLPDTGPPVLATLHLPPSFYAPGVVDLAGPRVRLACVSWSQRRGVPASARVDVVENGIRLDALRFRARKLPFALALGRICPEKGFHRALDAARRASIPLLLAGQVFPYDAHVRYFEGEIVPRLDAHRRFLGPLGLARKRRLLAAARCLVVTSEVAETSSLVAMEALASGTPVVAFRAGALPELVEHGRTGLLVDDDDELADALEEAARLDPHACRQAALERFDSRAMAARYLDVYERLAREAHGARSPSIVVPRRVEAKPVRGLVEVQCLRREWQGLWQRASRATPFQSPAWLLAWWRHFAPSDPWFVKLVRGGRLVGVAPLLRYGDGDARVVGLMGGGVSDYQDVLFEDAHADAALEALLDLLEREGARWDECLFESMPGHSPLLERLPPAWDASTAFQNACPFLAFADGPDRVSASVPARMLEKIAYYRRRLAREHAVAFERATAASVDELLEALFRLHRARWAAKGEGGLLADARVQRFHHEAAHGLLAAGGLFLHALRLDGRLAAVLYGMRDARRAYYYLGGFDPAFRKLDLGTLLVAHAVDEAARAGLQGLDFLRGREHYKYAWGAADRFTFRRVLALDGIDWRAGRNCVPTGAKALQQ